MSFYWAQIISDAQPTATDREQNERLLVCLREHNFFESDEEGERREIVLSKIDNIVKTWCRQVSLKKKMSEQTASEVGGKIFTLGSYRLGVHQKGADIDTLVLVPRHVEREDFFNDLQRMLLARPEVTKLVAVPDAHTPIMKMVFSGIEIDLLHATLDLPSIPEDIDINDINVLRNLDERSVRSLNGPRVADALLRLVPNVLTYRTALCAIKLWAQRRGIYSNIMGYLGGIAWALMTARICQLYPNAVASTIVIKFFKIYRDWKWPNPVTLREIEDGPLGFQVWNPRWNPGDRSHLMPVITPAYPSMNSTYNVSMSTFTTMKEMIEEADETARAVDAGNASWGDLFKKSDFFSRYKWYLRVSVYASNTEELSSWRGFVESRLRVLIQGLERTPMVTLAVPYPDSYDDPAEELPPGEPLVQSSFFLGLKLDQPKPTDLAQHRVLDLTNAVDNFVNILVAWDRRQSAMGIDIKHLKWADLPSYVHPGTDASTRKRPRSQKSPDKPSKKKAKADAAGGEPAPSAPAAAAAAAAAAADDQRPATPAAATADTVVVAPAPLPPPPVAIEVPELGATADATDSAGRPAEIKLKLVSTA